MASNSLFSNSSPMLYWGELSLCLCVSHIMLWSSGMKLVLDTERSLELEEAMEPAMGLLITTVKIIINIIILFKDKSNYFVQEHF